MTSKDIIETRGNVVPFGKHKGRLIEELLVDDPNYLEWLVGQPWFCEKFVTLHQVIINRGAEPEETPEHNALQVLFLDDDECIKFLRAVYPDLAARMAGIVDDPSQIKFHIERAFEVNGSDVWLRVAREKGDCSYPFREGTYFFTFNIEIKPTVGDDYPAVLRQMRANMSFAHTEYKKRCTFMVPGELGLFVLFLERYIGTGATREQFVKTFETAGIRVVFREKEV